MVMIQSPVVTQSVILIICKGYGLTQCQQKTSLLSRITYQGIMYQVLPQARRVITHSGVPQDFYPFGSISYLMGYCVSTSSFPLDSYILGAPTSQERILLLLGP